MKTTEKNTVELSETKRLDQIISSRRAMIMALGGTALAGLVFSGSAQAQTTVTDTDILNFALNLEYLEAEYYTLATTGKTIDTFGVGLNGAGTQGGITLKTTGSPLVPFSTTNPTIMNYALETAAEERKHVTLLRNALGTSAAVAQPALDLFNSFNGLAVAANIGSAFDPFASEVNFLLGSYIFEDVGVTAYHGAAALLTVPANLVAASGLLGAEAYHAGLIRTVLFGMDAANPALGIAATTSKISSARATLDGTGNDDVGLGVVTTTDVGSAATVVNADTNAIAFARTTTQVLSIVYAGGAGKGGFFPAGLNGTIK